MSAIDQVDYLHENKCIEDGMISLWAKDQHAKAPRYRVNIDSVRFWGCLKRHMGLIRRSGIYSVVSQ
jgi:hypothetical protein